MHMGCFAFLALANFAASVASVLVFFGWNTLWSMRGQEDKLADGLLKTAPSSSDVGLVLPVITIAIAITSVAIAVFCIVQVCIEYRRGRILK